MAIVEEPITSRLDRLDHMLRHLEEIRGCNRSSPKSSCASIASSGTDGHASSVDLSPKSIEKHCRPIEHVIIETEVKGTLIERLELVEDRVLKLELLESERKMEEKNEKKAHKPKGLKQLVKQCVKGEGKY
ncbi:uncharacterized protein LOC121239951 isoform X2 [Juglans microcarpa x Juglans regia]|uniref:uncharacterized protein LOC121239951 isoform X2 n=1 Tax=Juglans microcarpa x Juglans regia TaxID=2249226 RepID=UPI001B7EAB56|nr:uncharacterized protein LOC121239951 isoform X2 [Juglans microcarpa x Juglans regia]